MIRATSTSAWRSAGVGIALVLVGLVYVPAGLGEPRRAWAAAAVFALGCVLGEALGELKARVVVPGAIPSVLFVVLLAMYVCVPETDQFLIAAIVPAGVLLAELIWRRQLGMEWYALAAASIAWAGTFGSAGRQSALLGAVFAWWPVMLPWGISRLRELASRRLTLTLVLIGSIASLAFARTGGLSDAGSSSALAVALLAIGSWAISWILATTQAPVSPGVG